MLGAGSPSLHMRFVSQGPQHHCYTDHWDFCSLHWSMRDHCLKHEVIHLPRLPSAELCGSSTWISDKECRAQCETCWALCTVLRCCCGVGGSADTLLLMESGSLFFKPITSFPGATKWINSVSARCLNFWLDYLHHGLIIRWDTGRWMVLLTDDMNELNGAFIVSSSPSWLWMYKILFLIHRTFPPSLHLQQMNFHHWRLLSQ